MSETVLKVENLSKLYELGEVGTGTLSHDLNRWWAKMRGKEDPFALVGQINDRNKKAESDFVWSLKDINFEVKQGEVLGIIGRNGAGKSTLLKIISQITSPTTGSIKAKGRIASLLEVGTGMNPELTARENIYLNGAILGMTRREIAAKFDEIVDFSGCTMYVDTPVKRFSSGMRVRLGFAVAAFLEPEILIVDEVLAVGDAEFQKKAIGKMKDISEGGGRTVLFVSHNLPSVRQLCGSCIYLINGQLSAMGETNLILDFYKNDSNKGMNISKLVLENSTLKINSIQIENADNITSNDEIVICLDFDVKLLNQSLAFSANVFNNEDILLFEAFVPFANDKNSEIKNYQVKLIVPNNILNSGEYFISILFAKDQSEVLLNLEKIIILRIEEIFENTGKYLRRIPGVIKPKIRFYVS